MLDTDVVLHLIRGHATGQAIDRQFSLSDSGFRPLICEVTQGELAAFSKSGQWGDKKRDKLRQILEEFVAVDISTPEVIDAYADISTLSKSKGWGIFQKKNDLWIAAAVKSLHATLLTTDVSDFGPLATDGQIDAIFLDSKTGARLSLN